MAAPKTLTELLRGYPPDELDRLANNLRDEIAKLSEQLRFIEDAQAGRKRSRRSDNGSAREGAPPTRLKRRELVPVIADLGRPVFPADVTQALRDKGLVISADSVRTSMGRLVDIDHLLVRGNDGRYSLASPSGNGSGPRLLSDPEPSSISGAAAPDIDRG